MTKAISAAVFAKVAQGMGVVEALKTVCGAEKVEAMIDALYKDLRA